MPLINLPSWALGPLSISTVPSQGGGGGGGSNPVSSNSSFTSSIASSSGGGHTYSTTGTSSNFGQHNKLATNGTYTIVSDDSINISHTGAGTTGSNQEILNAGWAWIVRNSDGTIMKSWNGMLNGDHGDSSLSTETDSGRSVTSKFITCQFGMSVGINDNYVFTGAPYRPVGGGVSNNNYNNKNAYIFAYKLSDFTLAKVWKVNDFNAQILPRSGGPLHAAFGSGLLQNGITATNDGVYIPASHVKSTFADLDGGAVVYFDISDSNPANWSSTPDTVIKNPINVVSNPTTNWGQGNYSNGNFGQSGAYVYDTKLIVAHATRAHYYQRSGTSFSETSSFTPTYYIGDRYQAIISTGKVPMVNGSGVGSTLTLRDPSNSWSTDWTKTLPGDGYPGYNVHVDIDHDKILSGDGANDANGTDDGLITVYNSDGTVHATVNNPTPANTKFGSSFVVKNAKLVASVEIGGSSSTKGLQFMDLGYGTSGGGGGTTFGGKSISQIGTPWVFDGPDSGSGVDTMTGLRWVDSGNKLVASIQTSGSNNSYGIYEFDTTTAYSTQPADISYNNVNFLTYNEIADADFSPLSIEFNNDGSVGYFGEDNEIFGFSMSTNYDISTATGSGHTKTSIPNAGAPYGYGAMQDIKFNSDGTKMFISEISGNQNAILEFSLSSAYDVTTRSTSATATFNPTTAGNSTATLPAIHFNSDGTKMYAIGSEIGGPGGVRYLYEYDLSTGFDISTMSYNNEKLDLETFAGIDLAQALTFNDDFSKIYIACGNDGLFEFQWGTGSGGGGGTPDTIDKATGSLGLTTNGTTNSQWFEFNGDGTSVFVHNSGSGGLAPLGFLLNQFNLTTAYDLTTATYSNDVYYGSGNDFEGKFAGDGSKFYFDSGSMWQHNLSTPFVPGTDIKAANNADGQGPSGESFCFKNDGTKLYTLAKSNTPNGVIEWDLSSAWDITTNSLQGGAIAGNNLDYSNEMTGASNIEMNSTGTKVYIYTRYSTISGAPIAIVEYDMTTPWDINTGTYNGKYLNVGSDGFTTAERISFRLVNDNKVFIKGPNSNHSGNDVIYQYTIPDAGASPAPKDISDATLVGNAPAGLFSAIGSGSPHTSSKWSTFGNNGTKLYLYGGTNPSFPNEIASYSLSTPYDITTASIDTSAFNPTLFLNPDDVMFNPAGTKIIFFEVSGNPSIKQYDLNTPWNHTSIASTTPSATISNDPSYVNWDRGIFADGGSKFYAMQANSGGKIVEFTCSTPGDLATASAVGSSNELVWGTAQGNGESRGLAMSSDGKKLYVGFDLTGDANEQIFQYDLSTAFDLSTATYNNKVLSDLRNDNFAEIRKFHLVDDTDLYIQGLVNPSGGQGMWKYNIPQNASGGGGSNALANGWTVRSTFSGMSNERFFAIDGDNSGNLYAAGYDAVDDTILVAQYDKDGSRQWSFNAGGNGDRLYDTAVDMPGNMISVGYTASSTPLDAIIVKYANNTHTWTKALTDGNSSNWLALAVAVDKTQSLGGDIYVAGATESQSISGNRNPFVVKLNSNGAVQWAKKYDHGGQQSQPEGIALDSNGDIFVSGRIHEPITGGGYSSGMVMKLSGTDGSVIWQKIYDDGETVNGYHNDQFQNCAVTPEDDVLTCGWTNTDYLGSYYGVVLKLSGTDGSIVWDRRTVENDGTKKIAVDSAGKIYTFTDSEVLFVYASDGTLEQEWKITASAASDAYYLEDIMIDHKDNAIITGFHYTSGSDPAQPFITKLPATIQAGTSGDFVITAQTKGDVAGGMTLNTHTSYSANTLNGVSTSNASNLTPSSVSATTTGPNTVTGQTAGSGNATPNIQTLTYTASFDTANETTAPKDLQFNADGSKMFVIDESTRKIYRYTTANYSIASASYDSVSYDFSGTATAVNGFTFNGDGTSFYIIGNDQGGSTPDTIFQFDMSTAFDIANASYSKQGTTNNNGSSADPTPQTVIFNDDGTKVYVSGSANGRAYQFKLSTPYDISTISPDVSAPSQIKNLVLYSNTWYNRGKQFSHDGKRLFVLDSEPANPLSIDEYILTTAYDLDTASYNTAVSIAGNGLVRPEGLHIKPDGTGITVIDGHKTFATAKVFEYTTSALGQGGGSFSGWVSTIQHALGSSNPNLRIRGVAVDSNDNVILGGDDGLDAGVAIKLDSTGSVVTAKSWGTQYHSHRIKAVAVDSSDNAVFAGYARDNWNKKDGYIMKLDSSFNKVFDKWQGEGYDDENMDVAVVNNGSIYAIGESASYNGAFSSNPAGYVAKLDTSGNGTGKSFTNTGNKSYAIGISSDGVNPYILGKDFNQRLHISKLDHNLSSVTWSYEFGATNANENYGDIDTDSNGVTAIVINNQTNSIHTALFANNGHLTWKKDWSKANTDMSSNGVMPFSIKMLANGGVAVLCMAPGYTTATDRKSFYILVYSSTGTLELQREFRLGSNMAYLEVNKSLDQTSDGALIVATTWYDPAGSGSMKSSIFKIDPTDTGGAHLGTYGSWTVTDISDGTDVQSTAYSNISSQSGLSLYSTGAIQYRDGNTSNSTGYGVSAFTPTESKTAIP